jgi:hypothetical protein
MPTRRKTRASVGNQKPIYNRIEDIEFDNGIYQASVLRCQNPIRKEGLDSASDIESEREEFGDMCKIEGNIVRVVV